MELHRLLPHPVQTSPLDTDAAQWPAAFIHQSRRDAIGSDSSNRPSLFADITRYTYTDVEDKVPGDNWTLCLELSPLRDKKLVAFASFRF